MRKIIGILVFLMLFGQANAQQVYYKDPVPQGNLQKVTVKDDDLTKVEGRFNAAIIKFFPVTRLPNFDEPISRQEFLELLFLNTELEGSAEYAYDYPDVESGNAVIARATDLGLVSGYADGLFRPDNTVTRGQAAKILLNTFEPSGAVSVEFPDLPVTHHFFEVFSQAIAAGYFQGYPDGLLRPDRLINFSEAETVIKRASGLENLEKLPARRYFVGYTAGHRINDSGPVSLRLKFFYQDGSLDESYQKMVYVAARDYRVISFSLAEEKTELFGKDYQDQTWAKINAAKAKTSAEQLWEGKFEVPTEGEITLGFGDKLYINGAYSGSHFGIDYANNRGTPVYASNHGIVTMADETPSYGKTVIIDHGMNIFSMYNHLDTLEAEVGAKVQKGDLIGKMGSTGIATGDHLHFTIFAGEVIVDNNEFYENVI